MQPVLVEVEVTVKVKVPVTVGVPERTPADESDIRSASCRSSSSYVYGLVPPLAVSGCAEGGALLPVGQRRWVHRDRWAASEHHLVDLERIFRCRVARAGRDHQHVSRLVRGIDVRPTWLSIGRRIVVFAGPKSGQERIAQGVVIVRVGLRFRSRPTCHCPP